MTGPVVNGVDFNHFQKITVSSADFEENADCVFRFRGAYKNILLINEGSGVVEYSFNGNTLHGDLTPSTDSSSINMLHRAVSKIWFRLASGSPSVIRIEAWPV